MITHQNLLAASAALVLLGGAILLPNTPALAAILAMLPAAVLLWLLAGAILWLASRLHR